MIDGIKLKNECVQWIRDWFAANGKNCNAVVGISGGKDSTVVAGLLAEALGPGRVIGVLMPNGHQSDLDDAIKVCEVLDITYMEINIANAFKRFYKSKARDPRHIGKQSEVDYLQRRRFRQNTDYGKNGGTGVSYENTYNKRN